MIQYADTDITDLLFCIFCQTSNTPTEVMTFRGDLYGQTEQNGKPVDYSVYKGLRRYAVEGEFTEVCLTPLETWGDERRRLFAFEIE